MMIACVAQWKEKNVDFNAMCVQRTKGVEIDSAERYRLGRKKRRFLISHKTGIDCSLFKPKFF